MATLGCPKNRVDSEVMLGTLGPRLHAGGAPGGRPGHRGEHLRVHRAGKQESVDTILELAEFKKTGGAARWWLPAASRSATAPSWRRRCRRWTTSSAPAPTCRSAICSPPRPRPVSHSRPGLRPRRAHAARSTPARVDRLPQDLRGLRQRLRLLHHPHPARSPALASHRRLVAEARTLAAGGVRERAPRPRRRRSAPAPRPRTPPRAPGRAGDRPSVTTSHSAACTRCVVVTASSAEPSATSGSSTKIDLESQSRRVRRCGTRSAAFRRPRSPWRARRRASSAAGGGTVHIHSRSRSFSCGQVADVELGVLELRAPVQRVERADLDADAAVHAEREVDREPVEHVAAAVAAALGRRRDRPPCASRCRCTSRGTRGRTACRRCSSPRCSAITPRERGGSSGIASGYCAVTERWVIVPSVTARPLSSPDRIRGEPLIADHHHSHGGERRAGAGPAARGPARRAAAAGPRAAAGTRPAARSPRTPRAHVLTSVHSQPSWSSERAVPAAEEQHGGQRARARRCRRTRRAGTARTAARCTRCSGPKMISESATGMSNGGRCSSASPAMKNTTSAGSCQSSHHGCQASTMPGSDSVPAAIATLTRRPAPAAARRPAAGRPRACRRAASTCWPRPAGHQRAEHADAHHREDEEQAGVEVRRRPGRAPSGIADQHDEVGHAARPPGASRKTRAVGGGRDDVLLLHELHPVGDELGPAVEAAGVHRAEPALHVRHRPCARSGRRAAAAPGTRRGRRRRAGTSARARQPSAPAARRGHHCRVGDAGRAASGGGSASGRRSDSPGSLAPGHGLATRAASTKSLRSGCPSNPSGSSSGSRFGVPRRSRSPNISWVSRSCQAAPRKTPTTRRRRGSSRGTPGAQQQP